MADTLDSAAHSYFELLGNRREAEATRFVRLQHEWGIPLRSIYTDILAPALAEAGDRYALGTLSAARRLFVTHATERIMSLFESALLRTPAPSGSALCASFGAEAPELHVRIAAALLALDGYDACHLGPNANLEDFECVLDQSDPSVFILFASSSEGASSLANAVERVRAKRALPRPLVIVGGAGIDPQSPWWRRSGADLHVTSAFEAVTAATARGYPVQERA
jgi:methanogenic corrinoid protein MtbC1